MVDDFSAARASAHGSLGNSPPECLNSNRRCCRLEFPVTPCKQTTRVSNRRKSAIYFSTQQNLPVPLEFEFEFPIIAESRAHISNSQIRRLETDLNAVESAKVPALIAKILAFAFCNLERNSNQFSRAMGTSRLLFAAFPQFEELVDEHEILSSRVCHTDHLCIRAKHIVQARCDGTARE
jgi:hypothetical protein